MEKAGEELGKEDASISLQVNLLKPLFNQSNTLKIYFC